MKKVKYTEVPKEYRRNNKERIATILKMIVMCLCFAMFIAIMFWIA